MSAPTAIALGDEMRLDHGSLEQLFVGARTYTKWLDRPVDEGLLRELYERLPTLLPHVDARTWVAAFPAEQSNSSARPFGSSMQGAYLILAARALGLDAGPIGGFDSARVDAVFFPGAKVRTNFLVNPGYGDPAGLYSRNPRLDFDEACRIN